MCKLEERINFACHRYCTKIQISYKYVDMYMFMYDGRISKLGILIAVTFPEVSLTPWVCRCKVSTLQFNSEVLGKHC